jgi:hypothetical protein
MLARLLPLLALLTACEAPEGDDPVDDGRTVVTQDIDVDTVWTADREWVLDGWIHVTNGARLLIEPGTRVLGLERSALVSTRGAFIEASGRPDAPIVFTSALPEGERYRGAWGGVSLLGSAPVNDRGKLEGQISDDPRLEYGGDDERYACGKLEYVRIEFAGYEATLDNELNALTLAGCGSGTIVRNVQTHRTLDDGIEVFGGTVHMSHLLITDPGDDGLDWQGGWVGSAQFVIVHLGDDEGDNALEGDNNADAPAAVPTSSPNLFNFTLVGRADARRAHRGVLFRNGTNGLFANFLATGFTLELMDIIGTVSAGHAETGTLWMANGVAWNVGIDGAMVTDDSFDDDDEGFDETSWIKEASKSNAIGTYGGLATTLEAGAPDYVPNEAASEGREFFLVPDDEHLDQSARFLGAVAPWEDTPFYEGWTAFPEN